MYSLAICKIEHIALSDKWNIYFNWPR